MSDTSILVSPGDRLTIVLPEHVITCQVLHTRSRPCACYSGELDAGAQVAVSTDGGRYPVPTPTCPLQTLVVEPIVEVDRNGGQSPIIRQG